MFLLSILVSLLHLDWHCTFVTPLDTQTQSLLLSELFVHLCRRSLQDKSQGRQIFSSTVTLKTVRVLRSPLTSHACNNFHSNILLRAVSIPYFHFRYDTDISVLNISQYQYRFDISTLQMTHTFFFFFLVSLYCGVFEKAATVVWDL